MICTVATFGRAIAVSASSTVSTRDPVGGDCLLVDEGVQGVEDPVVGVDGGRRAVQLDQVDGVDAEVASGCGPASHGTLSSVNASGTSGSARRPILVATVTPSSAVLAQGPADQLLAATVAVDVGGVEERDAGLDSCAPAPRARRPPRHRPSRRRAANNRDR